MRHAVLIAAALALAASVPAYAQTIDKKGKCHDASGKFAKMDVCKGLANGKTDNNGPFKLDAKGNCHDVKGRMAKKTMCAAGGQVVAH